MLVAMMAIAQLNDHGDARTVSLPPLACAGIAFGIVLALLALTFAFRSVGKRH